VRRALQRGAGGRPRLCGFQRGGFVPSETRPSSSARATTSDNCATL